jgi:hypothetical protein
MTHRAKARKLQNACYMDTKKCKQLVPARTAGPGTENCFIAMWEICEKTNKDNLDNQFFLPTSEEPTQNLVIATAGIYPSGVTG